MEEEDIPPFLLQPTEGRQAASIFLNSGVILLLLIATAFAFGFRAIWDSLNPVSVLLAVVCLFLGQDHGGDRKNGSPKSTASTPMHHWYQETVDGVFSQLLSSNSYRDLRRESLKLSDDKQPPYTTDSYSDTDPDQFQDAISDDDHRRFYGTGSNSDRARARSEPPQEVESYDERWRFHDDTNLNGYGTNSNRRFFDDTYFSGRRVNSDSNYRRDVLSPATALEQQQNLETSDDHRHRIGSNFHPPVKQREVKDNNERWRFYDDTNLYGRNNDEHWRFPDDTHLHGYRSGSDSGQMQVHPPFPEVFQKPVPSAPPLQESPPLPWPESPTEVAGRQENFNAPTISPPSAQPLRAPASRRSAKKREMDLLASLRRKKRKKKNLQRQNSVENLAGLFDPQSPFYQSSNPPPSATPDPPPSRSDGESTSREPRTTVEAKPPKPSRSTSEPPKPARSTNEPPKPARSTHEPPKPARSTSKPPAPSFGVIPWRFEWHGDFVRAASFTESMCGSSDLDGAEPPGKEPAAMAGGSGASTSAPSSCSSPDVNVKAGKFIANFRADLMMLEMNSKKARLNSRAGPDLGRKGPT